MPIATWWLALSLIGWLTWPLVAVVFPHSAAKGYGFARIFGLLLVTYVHWLLSVAGILPNSPSAMWGVVLSVACAGTVAGCLRWRELRAALGRDWRHVLTVEVLFLVTFIAYALHRSHDAAIAHTEQPMDFAFLNAMLRSARLPPSDPWMAGQTINYYYLGYLTVAALCRVTATRAAVGYQLGLAHTLALAMVAAYSVMYDMSLLSSDRHEGSPRKAIGIPVLGAIALGLASNLEGALEFLHAWGVFPERMYAWLGITGLAGSPRGSLLPQGSWWWWRASRIITDYNYLGRTATVISEFPAFSFVLGDLHPHVLSLPYLVASLGLAVEAYHAGREGLGAGWWRQWRTWAYPWFWGSLGFLNSWDLPTALLAGVGAFALGALNPTRVYRDAAGRSAPSEATGPGLSLPGETLPVAQRVARRTPRILATVGPMAAWCSTLSIVYYLPFYLHLVPTAQGIGLVYYAKTSLRHYVLCFGLWLLPIVAELIGSLVATKRSGSWHSTRRRLLMTWLVVFVAPWILMCLLGGWGRLLLALGSVLVGGPWLTLLQSGLVAALWVDLHDRVSTPDAVRDSLGLVSRGCSLLGIALTYGTEFLFVRDVFGTRMNTVFKVYYQAWALLAVAAVCSAYQLWLRLDKGGLESRRHAASLRWPGVVLAASAAVLGMCLLYPFCAAYSKAGGYEGPGTLDGTAFLQTESPDEYAAYVWIAEHASSTDVLAEAPGEEYDPAHSRLSGWTGVPSVLGWGGHERQWRPFEGQIELRVTDLATMYGSSSQEEVLSLLAKYHVSYMYVGPHERATYGIDEPRLAWYGTFLQLAWAQGDAQIFRVP